MDGCHLLVISTIGGAATTIAVRSADNGWLYLGGCIVALFLFLS